MEEVDSLSQQQAKHAGIALLQCPQSSQKRTLDGKFGYFRLNCLLSTATSIGQRNGTLYVGVTGDLIRRIHEHKNDLVDGFLKNYGTHSLVYFEQHETMDSAIVREKQIKKWNRQWKLELIEESNPEWKDLYKTVL